MRLLWCLLIGMFPAALLLPRAATAQVTSSRPVRLIVPYPAGGPTDALARILAQEMPRALGQPAHVENKPGASGALGTREVARAAPDGHTLVLGTNQTHATNMLLLKEPGYDARRDFVVIAGIAELQHALVVPKSLRPGTVEEMIAIARQAPGKLNYGSTGVGSASHLTMELFLLRTESRMTHVAFRGAAPMVFEIVAGRIDAAFATLPSVLGQIEAGEIRALALASHTRARQLPELRLLKEHGIPDGEGDAWLAVFAPAGTAPSVVARLEIAVRAALDQASAREAAAKVGIAINFQSRLVFGEHLERELVKWGQVVKAAGLKAE